MQVKAILENKPKQIISARPSTPIDEAMGLLLNNKIGCLLVLDDEDKLVGILSDKDIFARIYQTKGDYHSLKIEDLMTTDLIVGLPSDDVEYIAGVMEKNTIRHLPILKDGQVVGLISLRDIIKAQVEGKEVENRYLVDMLERRDKSGDV
jgi:CBS domain-containing protein